MKHFASPLRRGTAGAYLSGSGNWCKPSYRTLSTSPPKILSSDVTCEIEVGIAELLL
jgi:hypothetical protein